MFSMQIMLRPFKKSPSAGSISSKTGRSCFQNRTFFSSMVGTKSVWDAKQEFNCTRPNCAFHVWRLRTGERICLTPDTVEYVSNGHFLRALLSPLRSSGVDSVVSSLLAVVVIFRGSIILLN